MHRRQFFLGTSAVGVSAGGIGIGAWQLWPEQGLLNPCLALPMPESLANHELVQAAWEGLNASKVWDMHVHLIGNGDSGSGAWANPAMYSLLQPFDYLHGAFYANAACLDTRSGNVDRSYVARLLTLHGSMRHGVRPVLRGAQTVKTAAALARWL